MHDKIEEQAPIFGAKYSIRSYTEYNTFRYTKLVDEFLAKQVILSFAQLHSVSRYKGSNMESKVDFLQR